MPEAGCLRSKQPSDRRSPTQPNGVGNVNVILGLKPSNPYPLWITAPARNIEITCLTRLHLKVEIVRLEFGYAL